MLQDSVLEWLLEGDVSIQYQTQRDLLDNASPELQERIALEGWGAEFLRRRRDDKHWGQHYYQPKWTSTHYTLIDLKNLGICPATQPIRDTVNMVLEVHKAPEGGIYPIGKDQWSDLCIDGMFLNVSSYFMADESQLRSIVDHLIERQMADGGYNCRVDRSGARHSSMHTTISVLEGLQEYRSQGYAYRQTEVERIINEAHQFLLCHRLFRSDHSGEIIDKRFLMLSYPSRWYYDMLRALEHFRAAGAPYDPRMDEAFEVLRGKRRKDGTWPVQAKHPGAVHFEMERTGGPSRWNTLRVLRVAKHFEREVTLGNG